LTDLTLMRRSMGDENDLRPGERAIPWREAADASLSFIGRIHTPWIRRIDCPRQGRFDGPVCRIRLFDIWKDALAGIADFDRLETLYWLHGARRDLVLQSPRHDGSTRGTFALRSPVRPNPIGTSIVKLEEVQGTTLFVRGLDCLDGTPLIDIKPDRTFFTSQA
jgi:tRNA (adenine37-N6)-methyltransferase